MQTRRVLAGSEGVNLSDPDNVYVQFMQERRFGEPKLYRLTYVHGVKSTEDSVYIPAVEVDHDEKEHFAGVAIFAPGEVTKSGEPLPLKGFKKPLAVKKQDLTEEAWNEYRSVINKNRALAGSLGALSVGAATVGLIEVIKRTRN